MKKIFFISFAAALLLTGAASAQNTTTDTTTSTTTTQLPAPTTGSYSASKSQQTIQSNGTEVDKTQSYVSGVNGSSSSNSVKTTSPDGSATSNAREERTISPQGETTTTSRTTTSTNGQ